MLLKGARLVFSAEFGLPYFVRFSLVVATLGRTAELRRLLDSLEQQTHQDFDVIVVDQNVDERLLPILSDFDGRLDLRRLTSPPGVSRARNQGIREVTGEVVCFPDDDCWYSIDLLQNLDRLLAKNPKWHAVMGEAVDEFGQRILPWPDRSGRATKPVSWRQALAVACFVRAEILRRVGGFDESIGPGADVPWGCGEDNDLMLRIIESGYHVQYEKSLRVNHPRMFLSFDEPCRAKRYKYSLGDGRLLRKHPMPLWWKMLFFAVPVCRMMFAIARLRGAEAKFHWVTAEGRVKGFLPGEIL